MLIILISNIRFYMNNFCFVRAFVFSMKEVLFRTREVLLSIKKVNNILVKKVTPQRSNF